MKIDEMAALLPSTFRWLSMLPKGVRPMRLGQEFPRIANKLAILWEEPAVCRKFLTSFMLDDRGDRHGFPPEVIMELSALEVYIDTGVVPARSTLQKSEPKKEDNEECRPIAEPVNYSISDEDKNQETEPEGR